MSIILGVSSPASAYIGPGAAIGLIGSALGFSSMVIFSVVLGIAWPLWWLFKKFRKKRPEIIQSDVNDGRQDSKS